MKPSRSAESDDVRMAPFTLRFSNLQLELEFELEDFAATEALVPIFSLVVCLLSLALITVVPSAMAAAWYIFPMFITGACMRLAVQLMSNKAQALALYCWSWTLVTFATFTCWIDAQRRFELVTGMSPYFLLCVCVLLVVVAAHLRLLIGAMLPRITTLFIYLVGWACTWPRISVVGWPLEAIVMCGSIVVGHAMSHFMERDKRRAFLQRKLTAAPVGGRAKRRAPPERALRSAALGTKSIPSAAPDGDKMPGDKLPAQRFGILAGAPAVAHPSMNRLTLEFSNADIEYDFLLQDFRESGSLVIVFSFSVSALLIAFLVAFPSALPAAPFILPQFLVIGGVRFWVGLWDDERRALQTFSWTWLGVSVVVFLGWLVAQRTFVLLSGLSPSCMLFISSILCVVSCFLSMLVGAFLPRNLTLLVYFLGWVSTWPRVSVLSGFLEPILTGSAIILGGLIGHTWSHTRRIVHQSAHFEVHRRLEQAAIESERAAEEARQWTSLRFAEALRYINDVVIELGVASNEREDVRQAVVINSSASFGATFGRDSDHTPGLLFELVDPADDAELEYLLCSAPAASAAPSAATPARPLQTAAASAATSAIAFVKPDGTRRRFQLQVVRIESQQLHRNLSRSENLSELGGDAVSVRSSESGAASDLLHGPAVSLFVVCHDLSDALRQAERETEEKAHRVLNHTAKRVMANTSQCCRMAIEELKALALDGKEQSAGSRAVVDKVVGLLKTTLSESVTGYHMCRSAIVQAGIQSGDHASLLETFRLSQLFEDLGFAHHGRIELRDTVHSELRGDLQLLSCILFNAVHNALMHGKKASPIVIETQLEEIDGDTSFSFGGGHKRVPARLGLTVTNAAGPHHAALLAMGVDDLLAAAPTIASALRQQGAGAEGSTFLGLPEIHQASRLLVPRADVHLWVRPHQVVFELSVPLKLLLPATHPEPAREASGQGSRGGAAAPDHNHSAPCGREHTPSPPKANFPGDRDLPPGLIFVCCDDDYLPRIYAENVLLPTAQADQGASYVLGETYEEVVRVPDLVMELAEEHGHDKVFGIFDQNLTNYDEGALYGTALCRELRQRGFSGCLVIQSANDEVAAEREYLAAGADGCLGKVLRGGPCEVVQRIAEVFWKASSADRNSGHRGKTS